MSGKRIFDILFAALFIVILFIPMLIIGAMVKLSSKGPVFYISERIGKGNKLFGMYKYRTMKTNTPPVATHLLDNIVQYVTPIGMFLRRTSLDEIPQLFNILKGDMSFVGPRPALFNQSDLIELRTKEGIHELMPGLTGWAQINGRDELTIPEKVQFDSFYIKNRSFFFDMKILFITVKKVINKEGVSH